jgi:hypothetical protein
VKVGSPSKAPAAPSIAPPLPPPSSAPAPVSRGDTARKDAEVLATLARLKESLMARGVVGIVSIGRKVPNYLFPFVSRRFCIFTNLSFLNNSFA